MVLLRTRQIGGAPIGSHTVAGSMLMLKVPSPSNEIRLKFRVPLLTVIWVLKAAMPALDLLVRADEFDEWWQGNGSLRKSKSDWCG